MPTDLEIALQQGGQVQETDLQKAISAGGVMQGEESAPFSFVNRAIAGTLGAPVDLMKSLLSLGLSPKGKEMLAASEAIGGAESITRGLKSAGISTALPSERPDTLREQIEAGVGEGVSMLIPFTKTVQMASRGTGTTGRVSKIIWDTIRKHPALTAVTETTAGAGTGAGRQLAEATDRPELRTTFELGGAMLGGFAPIALTYTPVMVGGRLSKTVLKRLSLPFTEQGTKFRAGQFIKGQVKEPVEAASKAVTDTIGELPAAVATGEKRLMSLFNQLRNADPVTDADAIKKLSHSIYQLELELRSLGYGAPEVLQNVTKRRVASIQLGMNKRVADAMEIADNKLDALPIAKRQSQEARIVRDELETVMRSADAEVKADWARVPKKVIVEPNVSKKAYSELLKETPKAQLDDIPAVLKNSFIAKKKVKFPINVKETQGLRSKLLEVQRISKAEGKWNKARIAGDVADNLLKDMSKVEGSDALTVAIASTRAFKQRFHQGIVGDLLGHSKSGAPSISPELTLDVSAGRPGIKGAVDLNKVIVTPEARRATERYLSRSFTDFATARGTKNFNVNQASKWIANNEEVLDQFPRLRSQLGDIATAKQHADDTLSQMTARMKRIEDKRISVTQRFLDADPGKEIEGVFKSHDPSKMTTDLINKASKDTTGEARAGLKGAYVDHLINKSSIGAYNELGEQTISGKKLLSLFNENNGIYKKILKPEEMSRVRRIADELVKLEVAEGGKLPHVAIELEDTASNALRMVSRVGGAQFGRWVARMTGGGTVQTPGIFSERFKVFANYLTKDRAFQLVADAVTADDGGKLLNSLLLPIDKPTTPKGQSNLKELNNRVSLWLIGTGSRIMRDIEEERIEDRQGEVQAGPPELMRQLVQ